MGHETSFPIYLFRSELTILIARQFLSKLKSNENELERQEIVYDD